MKKQKHIFSINFPTSGFSLVETLVAITILLLIIVGPLSISSSSVRSTAFASEQVTAFFLAQEGAELAQKVRDEFMLEHFKNAGNRPNPWADFINRNGALQFCYDAAGCNMSMNTDTVGSIANPRSCSAQDACALFIDSGTAVNRARYNAVNVGVRTNTPQYTRRIRLQHVPTNTNEISVTSIVTWRSGFSREEQQVTVQSSIFNVYGTN